MKPPKKYFFVFFFILPLIVSAQDIIPKINGVYGYEEIINLDSTYTKELLYKNSKVYFVNSYKSANDVIQYDDKEEGKIIGKGFLSVEDVYDAFITAGLFQWDVHFTTEIISKNGKYKFRIYNISIKQSSKTSGNPTHYTDLTIDEAVKLTTKGTTKKLCTRLLQKTASSFNNTIMNLKAAMRLSKATSGDEF